MWAATPAAGTAPMAVLSITRLLLLCRFQCHPCLPRPLPPACSKLRGLHSTARKTEDPELQDFVNSKLHELVRALPMAWGQRLGTKAGGVADRGAPHICFTLQAVPLPPNPSPHPCNPTSFYPPLPAGAGHPRDGQLRV